MRGAAPLSGAWLLVAVASLAERRLQGARAQWLRGMWNLPQPGIEPVSPALAGGFLPTVPPGSAFIWFWNEGYSGLMKWTGDFSLFFCFPEQLREEEIKFSLKV